MTHSASSSPGEGVPFPPAIPPECGWLVTLFRAGRAEGALCLTGRAPDKGADDLALACAAAAYARTDPGPAAPHRDALLLHTEDRRSTGVRLAGGAAPVLATTEPPTLEGLQTLFVGADQFLASVSVSPGFRAEVFGPGDGAEGIQLQLLALMGRSLDSLAETRCLGAGAR